MSGTAFHTTPMVEQERYTDLLPKARFFCLDRAVARPPPKRLQQGWAAVRETVVESTRDFPGFRPGGGAGKELR